MVLGQTPQADTSGTVELPPGLPLKHEAWDRLSPGERRVAVCFINGLSVKETASLRGRTPDTIKVQHCALHNKLGVHSRQQLFRALVHVPRLACDERGRVTILPKEYQQ